MHSRMGEHDLETIRNLSLVPIAYNSDHHNADYVHENLRRAMENAENAARPELARRGAKQSKL